MAIIGAHLKTDKSCIFYTSTELRYLNKLPNQTYSFLEKRTPLTSKRYTKHILRTSQLKIFILLSVTSTKYFTNI